MKKTYDLWEYLTPPIRRIIQFFKILLFTMVISVLGVNTITANPIASSGASESEFQQAGITGTVTDETTHEAMIGVNIQVKGTTVGAITDVNGKYTILTADKNAVLLFSFIGYVTQEIPVGGKVIVNVSLVTNANSLEEVVIVGYGVVKKPTLTGSVASIRTADILTTKTSSVASMIQGKIPGLMIRKTNGEPGVYNSMISVRGFGTPLLVIDGVVRDGMSDFERLNPNDIENITILKDASAAIYGMNADNGVLMVTTKSGTKGKTKISYSGIYSYKQPTTTDLQKGVDAYTYRLMKNEMSRNAGQPEPFTATEIEKWRLGTDPGYQDFNWYDAMYTNHISSVAHNFSITGGNDDITHYTSFGYMNDEGLLHDNRTENYQKYNFRTSFDAKLAKGLKARVIFAGKYDNKMSPGGNSYFWIFKQTIVSDRGIGPYTLANTNHPTSVPPEGVNALAQINKDMTGYGRQQNYQYQATTELTYDIPLIKGLTLGVLGAYDGNINQSTTLHKYPILYDYKTDGAGTAGLSNLSDNLSLFSRGDVQSKISYKNTFAQAHTFSALLVNEIRMLKTRNVQGYRQYDQIYTFDILGQASATNQTTGGNYSQEAYISYLGRFNYDFKNKYIAEFSFREDGSYRYAPDKRWAFFPSASFGWRASEESFMKNNLPAVSNLKFRASYGKMGADPANTAAWQYVPGYKLTGTRGGAVLSPDVITLGMTPPGVINNNLTWINTSTADIGMDLDLWKGKLGIVADIFQKNRSGLLSTRSSAVPNTFGASFPQENLNSDHYKGFEVEVSHKGQIGDIKWGVSANLTYSRRYVDYVERSAYTNTMAIWKDGNAGNDRVQNRLWIYKQDGVFTNVTQFETAPLQGGSNGNSKPLVGESNIVDVNGDGVINSSDQLPIDWSNSDNPPMQYGMTMSASWKGFDLNMLLQGASLFSYPINRGDTWGYRVYPNMWSFWMDRWHQADITVDPHDPAAVWIPGKYEALMNSASGTTIDNGTFQWNPLCNYLRIKNLEIGYTLPSNLTKKAFMENVRVAINIVNLATFTNKELKKFDPEKSAGDYNAGGNYPLLREFNFAININF